MSSFCMKVKNAKWGQEEGIWNDKRCNYGNRRAQSRQKGQKEGIICFTLGWHQQSLPPRRRLQNGNPKVLTTDDGRRTDWPGSKKEGTGGHKKGITGNCNLPFYPFSCKFGHQLALLINSYFLKFYASAKFLKGFQPRTLGSIDQTLCAFLIKQNLHCPLLSGCLNGHLEETRNLKKRVLLFSIFSKKWFATHHLHHCVNQPGQKKPVTILNWSNWRHEWTFAGVPFIFKEKIRKQLTWVN